jgi:hypothetical protein
MPADGVGQRFQQRGGLADPVRERGSVEVQPVALEDLALAIEGKVADSCVDAPGDASWF